MHRLALGLIESLLLASFLAVSLYTQAQSNNAAHLRPALPFSFEFAQHLNPWDRQGKTATDGFSIASTIRSFSSRYSSFSPGTLSGKQFQAIPAGYHLMEFTLKPKWGLLQAFSSTDHNSRLLPQGLSRDLSGGGLEIPKSIFGARVAGYFVHAAPSAPDDPNSPPTASQAGLALSRDINKKLSLLTEWTESRQGDKNAARSRSGRGFFVRARGNPAGAESSLTYRLQSNGLVNPSMPVPGRQSAQLAIDVTRAYKKHKVLFGHQTNSLGNISALQLPFLATRQDSIQWSYMPKLWPQISASVMRTSQQSSGVSEDERTTRLSANKAVKKFYFALAHTKTSRDDLLHGRPLWQRSAIIADATVEVQTNNRLSIHYESSGLTAPYPTPQLFHSDVLQANTRLSILKDKFAIQPAIDYVVQQDCGGGSRSALTRMLVSAALKPAKLPTAAQTELLFSFTAQRARFSNRPGQDSIAFVVQWHVKRL